MKLLTTFWIILTIAAGAALAQTKTVPAAEIVRLIAAGEAVRVENAVVEGDLDLTRLADRINDAVYPEGRRTARVYTAVVRQPVAFANVRFAGRVDFFRAETDARELREYRVQFADGVAFRDCTFERDVDFELTNFDAGVSFAGSIFRAPALFVRIGLEGAIDFTGTEFAQRAVYRFTQNTETRLLTAAELQTAYARR